MSQITGFRVQNSGFRMEERHMAQLKVGVVLSRY